VLQSTSLDTVLLRPLGRERFGEFVRRKGFESYKVIPFFNFEVRHPRCVSQITKLYSRRLKSKHNYIIYIYIYNRLS